MSEPLTLTPESVEAIALRVAELVTSTSRDVEVETAGLVDATEIARRFSISRDYVYAHADELAAVRLGSGPKARLRFNPQRVLEALAPQPFAPAKPLSKRRPRPRASTVELLPIEGQR